MLKRQQDPFSGLKPIPKRRLEPQGHLGMVYLNDFLER